MIGSHNFLDVHDVAWRKEQQGPQQYLQALVKDILSQVGMLEAYAYLVATLLIIVGYHICSDGIFSCIVSLASVIQLLGLVLCLMKVMRRGSFGTVSVKSLQLYVPVYSLRLSCTLFNEGYLPIDRSGDWAYQVADVASLAVVLLLLTKSLTNSTVQEERFPVFWCVVGSILLAILVHPCHNLGTWSDVTWTASVYLETFVMVPQLALVGKSNSVESLTSHSITCTAIYRGLNFWFWFVCRRELMRVRCPTRLPSYFIVSALALQVLLLLDFVYYYVRAIVTKSEMTLRLPGF